MAANFVKFQRGTQAQYDRLKTAGRLESDALYFIYDAQAPENGGLLYLGEVLIGGTGSAVGASALNDLTDVDLSGVTLLDGMILQYNATSATWEAVAGSDLLPSISSGSKTGTETGPTAAARIDNTPLKGDIVFVDNVPYIYNGSTWQLLVGDNLEGRVVALENGLQTVQSTLQTIDGKIATAIANANHLKYEKVSALPAVADAATNVIYLVGDSSTAGDNKYEEWMLVDGVFEHIGKFDTDLSGYATISYVDTQVGNLTTALNGLQSNLNNYVLTTTYNSEVGSLAALRSKTGVNSDTVVDVLIDVYDRLTWNPLPDVTDPLP